MFKNILILIFIMLVITSVEAQTTKHFDIIKNNDNTDITLDPTGAVIFNYTSADTIPYLDVNKKLQSTAVTKTILQAGGNLVAISKPLPLLNWISKKAIWTVLLDRIKIASSILLAVCILPI